MARNNTAENTQEEQQDEYIDRLVGINRVAKVIKGGRRFAFAALMVVGDGKGRVGYGSGKAREVPDAIKKASQQAKRNMVKIPLREGRTLHHDIKGRFGAGRVILRSAPPGTGIIAGGPLRAIFEALGVQDVVAKSNGTQNPYNMVKATMDALMSTESPRQIAARRNRRVNEVTGKAAGEDDASEDAPAPKAKKAAPAKKAETKSEPKAEKKETKKPAAKKAPAKKAAAKKTADKKDKK